MNSLTKFCWLGFFAFFAFDLYGQRPDEVLYDLVISVEKDKGLPLLGMGGAGAFDPGHPDKDDNFVVSVVNNSKRDVRINPKNVRIYADGGRQGIPLRLIGVAFLQDGEVTVPAGKPLDILKVPLADILDPATLKAQRTICWGWPARPNPPTSPIMPNEKDYANVCIFWVDHIRDRHVLRSRPLVIPVKSNYAQ